MAAAFLFRLMRAMLALGSFLAVGGLSSSQPKTPSVELAPREDLCPPCEFFFRKLERNKETGKLTQAVRVQERGEPKSGTGLMLDWATGALDHACIYLQRLYGRESCVLDVLKAGQIDNNQPGRAVTRRMVFKPALGASEARCPCETIDRVSIDLSKDGKHSLPVNTSACAFSHNGAIELAPNAIAGHHRQTSACTFADGTRPNNIDDIWRCMQEANCDVTDDWLQLVVFRDPRLVVVSTYFHLKIHSTKEIGDLGDFVATELPIICEWMTVRHILFSGLLPHQSIEVWYGDAMADPFEWHYHFFDSVGLQLPYQAVNDAAEAAAANDLRFTPTHVDLHPGEEARTDTSARKFEDEVSSETLKLADDILRQWLPPVLLAKLGVAHAQKERV